jgi:hypothetical protein
LQNGTAQRTQRMVTPDRAQQERTLAVTSLFQLPAGSARINHQLAAKQ